jgi:hypothetical protein
VKESAPTLLRIRDWAGRFENSRTRELRTLNWIPESTDLSSDFFVAAKSTPRGDLRREDGRPHDAQSLARVLRMPKEFVEEAIPRLIELGDIESVNAKSNGIKRSAWRRDAAIPHDAATTLHDPARTRQRSAATEKLGNSSSSEGKEKKRSETPEGNERKGTEPRVREMVVASEQPPVATPSNSQNGDDDDSTPPEQKLSALFEQNHDLLTDETLRVIRETLELRGVTIADFVKELAPRLKPNGSIRSATAIALAFAKKFGSKTTPARISRMQKPEKPKCPTCHTTDTGRGLVFSDDGLTFVPCPACATPEFKLESAANEAERASRRPAEAGAA